MSETLGARWSGIGVGGCLALDFVNTLDWRLREKPVELLRSYGDLLRFAWSADVLDLTGARALQAWSEAHPRAAARALAGAISLREAMATLFQAVARGTRTPAEPLAELAAACREAWSERTLEIESDRIEWVWRDGPPVSARPARAAALDAARVLTSDERERVRECADAECGWLFLDVSRNRSRRWCTMEGCGNRNKARSFYQRSMAARSRRKARDGNRSA